MLDFGRIPRRERSGLVTAVAECSDDSCRRRIDAVLAEADDPGSLLPFDAGKIRRALLSRAKPDAVGMSPLGGLLLPPGLYRTAFVTNARRVALDETVIIEGPGIIEFDGDRERVLAAGERAELRVLRDGPWQIDVARALALGAERGLFLDRPHWHDEGDTGEGPGRY